MKKESKNLGFTKACAWCKKILFKYLNFNGTKLVQEINCKHCGKPNKIEGASMQKVTVTKIIILIVILLIGFSVGILSTKEPELTQNQFQE